MGIKLLSGSWVEGIWVVDCGYSHSGYSRSGALARGGGEDLKTGGDSVSAARMNVVVLGFNLVYGLSGVGFSGGGGG